MTTVRRFGVDEAGKGPVFGPMVVAAVSCNVATLPTGIRDSKQLSPSHRRGLATKLREHEDVNIATRQISAAEIDLREENMNELTVEAFADVIDQLATRGLAGTVDAADSNTERFKNHITEQTETSVVLTSEHGADESDPVVGAASIIAKVERDAAIEELAEKYGEIGSGYPSDPTTREYLTAYVEEHGRAPPFARHSWSTCQDALENTTIP